MTILRTTAGCVAICIGLSGASALAQGFEEGSFENPGGGAAASTTQPAPTGQDGGDFGESSFGVGGSEPVVGGSALPAPSGTPDPGPTIVASGSSDGGAFGESSFEDSGGTGSTPGGATPNPANPAGGADFPGGTGLPEPSGSTGVAGVDPQPNPGRTEPAVQPPNATPPAPQVDPQITAVETRDFGVPPQSALRQGQFHGPTPVAIPGGQLVTTAALVTAMNGGMQMVLIDVLGADYSIPGAFSAPGLAAAGNFQDRTQQQAAAWLGQITQGNRNVPIVIFCSDPMCWLSYNGALRAANAGYSNVYWYRGGLQAWQMAGLPLHPAGF